MNRPPTHEKIPAGKPRVLKKTKRFHSSRNLASRVRLEGKVDAIEEDEVAKIEQLQVVIVSVLSSWRKEETEAESRRLKFDEKISSGLKVELTLPKTTWLPNIQKLEHLSLSNHLGGKAWTKQEPPTNPQNNSVQKKGTLMK